MAFNTVPTVANGDSWSAAQHNTYIKDNFAAVWVGTTAGDTDYYTGASAKARLALGANGYIYTSISGAPSWQPFRRYVTALLNADVPLVVGDDAYRFRIPGALGGWDVNNVAMSRKSGTGVPAVQIRNVTTGLDILSTKVTIDSGETDSLTAATPFVINTANDSVTHGDQLAIDVDVAGTLTLYLYVEIAFLRP